MFWFPAAVLRECSGCSDALQRGTVRIRHEEGLVTVVTSVSSEQRGAKTCEILLICVRIISDLSWMDDRVFSIMSDEGIYFSVLLS